MTANDMLLIARLRDDDTDPVMLRQAADLIEAQAAEIARLTKWRPTASDAAGIVALVNAAPALLASAARAAELEAEVARLRGGPLITYRKGFGPGDGDSAVLEQKP